jgi:hypothetical protein
MPALRWGQVGATALTLSLTRQQRKALFAGEHPRILRSTRAFDELDWVVGRAFALSSKVSLVASGALQEEADQWLLLYTVKDDRPRLLRARTRSAGYEEGLRDDLVGAELVKASEASGYTHSPGAALRGSGEEVSRADQERFKKQSTDPALQLLRSHRAEIKGALDRIRDNPLLHGRGTFGSELRFAERKIEKVLSKLESRINETARRAV